MVEIVPETISQGKKVKGEAVFSELFTGAYAPIVNSEITIVEVYHDANSTNEYTKYWGKTTFGGITGWVAMGYLK